MADFENHTVQQITDILVAEEFSSAEEYARYYLRLTADLETEQEIAGLLTTALREEYEGGHSLRLIAEKLAAVIYNA